MKSYLQCLKAVVLFFCIVCISTSLNSQEKSSSSTQAQEAPSFRIGLDYASFRDFADTTLSYVEIYYSFNRKELEFASQEEGLVAKVLMQLSILDEEGNEVEDQMWNIWSKVKDAEEAKKVDYMIIDQVGTKLKPGNYKINLKATDVNSMSHGEALVDAEVKKFSTEKLQLSDVELALSINPDTTAGRLIKADQKVLPNPSRAFTHEGGMVYFYAELYNLVEGSSAKPEYELRFTVLDTTGKKLKDFGEQSKTKPGNSAVVISGINIGTLAGGEYLLQIEAKDKQTNQKAYSSKRFVVLREKTEEELYAEEIKRFKQDVIYIASPKELAIFDQLNFLGKRNFMAEFWKKKDPSPDTPENEFKIEHYNRLNYANLHFSRTRESNDGWSTDMGRIYITHGEPNEIERYTSTRGTKPWEQWNYHGLQGGVYFIFVDEDGYGVYRLVHSNMKGEVYDSQWEDRIKIGPEGE